MKKTAVVLDINIVISSLWRGNPKQIIELWDNGRILVCISPAILNEYISVLLRFDLSDKELEEFIMLFLDSNRSNYVFPSDRIKHIVNDPSDNKFLECAVSAKTDYIISGDSHLLAIKNFRNIPVLTAKNFLKII